MIYCPTICQYILTFIHILLIFLAILKKAIQNGGGYKGLPWIFQHLPWTLRSLTGTLGHLSRTLGHLSRTLGHLSRTLGHTSGILQYTSFQGQLCYSSPSFPSVTDTVSYSFVAVSQVYSVMNSGRRISVII